MAPPADGGDEEAAAELFFQSCPPLQGEQQVLSSLDAFLSHSPNSGPTQRIVLVTSGGTTVPLERRCVRFIDNFSAGNRGAASAECFLEAGYSVVFLFRRGSVRPFCRGLPDTPLLSCLELSEGGSSTDSNSRTGDTQTPPHLVAKAQYQAAIIRAIGATQQALAAHRLLLIPFTTLFEYLQLLRLMALRLGPLGRRAMLYLAAAVSDFYVPWGSMHEHKIQSGAGPLDMQLAQVPKLLPLLRSLWCPRAFLVSFKLETDPELLLAKARGAQRRNGVDAVVANELLTRTRKVVLLSRDGEEVLELQGTAEGGAGSTAGGAESRDAVDIEELIVRRLAEMHQAKGSLA